MVYVHTVGSTNSPKMLRAVTLKEKTKGELKSCFGKFDRYIHSRRDASLGVTGTDHRWVYHCRICRCELTARSLSRLDICGFGSGKVR